MSDRILENWSSDSVLDCLADRNRRAVVSTVLERTTSVSTESLATHALAEVTGVSLVDVSRAARDRFVLDLRHAHLPKLDDAALVEWDPSAGTVASSDHAALRGDHVRRLLGVEADDWDDVIRAITPTQRRIALSIVESEGEIQREELARRVADRLSSGVTDAHREAVRLHHGHLPALRAAGLIDTDDETVRYVGHPELDPEWLAAEPVAAIGDDDTAAGERAALAEGTWQLEGTAEIVARGQSLFEQADDELFLLITTDGLLNEGCIARLADAVDRGVDVYLGSQSAAVRDLVRETLPGAVIWEPQLDWINLPPIRERVGRLVLADREAVLVGTLGEPTESGYEEMAITGAGPDNAIVVLLRQLLGDRLDHLDAQSEDVLEQIPL